VSVELGLIAAGAGTGLLVGLTGVGGGALMTPLLLLVFGVSAPVAVATDLWFAALTKLAAIATHRQRERIDWLVVRRLWLGSLPVALGVAWLASAGVRLGKVAWLSQAVGAVVCIAALGLWFGPALLRRLTRAPRAHARSRWQAPLTVGAGAVVGFAVALTSVGAGTLGAVMLLALYPRRLTLQQLVLADLVHATGLALVAGLAYAASDLVDWRMLWLLLLGSLPAAVLGSRLAGRLPQRTLRRGLAAVLLLVGGKAILG
jgi:uncharacterized membrane protein YfcA